MVTANAERAAQVRADHPGAEVLGSADDLFAQPDRFDLVVVAATNDVHAPLAPGQSMAGKAVVVDKPLALTAADGAGARRRCGEPPACP